jgi:hypothetical protein
MIVFGSDVESSSLVLLAAVSGATAEDVLFMVEVDVSRDLNSGPFFIDVEVDDVDGGGTSALVFISEGIVDSAG